MSWVLFSICFTGRGQRKYKQFRHFITWLHCITGKLYVSIILESKVRLQFLETTSDILRQSQLKVTGRSVSFFGLWRGGFAFNFPRIKCVSEKGLSSRLPHQHCGPMQLRPRPFGRLLLIWWLGGQPVGSVLEGLLCSRNTLRWEMRLQGVGTPSPGEINGAQMRVQEGEEGLTLTSQLGKVDSQGSWFSIWELLRKYTDFSWWL